MRSIRSVVVGYLEDRDMPHVLGASSDVVGFLSLSDHGPWTMYVGMLEADDQVVVHSVFPDGVPEERREAMSVFVTRANFGILHGNFELDLDDGELRYKTSIDVRGAELTDSLFENVVIANVSMFDRYTPGIRAVLAGTDPTEAIASIEASV
jgi:hypothetical protein